MSIIDDENFKHKCSMLGIKYGSVTRINGNIAIKVTNSNLYVFMNNNYDVIGIEPALSLGSALQKMYNKINLYSEKIEYPYINGFSLQEISDLNSRVDFFRYDRLRVNNGFYSLDKNNDYAKMFGLFKFIQKMLNIYFKSVYPLMLVYCDINIDAFDFIINTLARIWALVNDNPDIKVSEVRENLGYTFDVGTEKYLGYVIDLFKTQDKDYTNMLKILGTTQNLDEAHKVMNGLLTDVPLRTFNDLVETLETDEPKR